MKRQRILLFTLLATLSAPTYAQLKGNLIKASLVEKGTSKPIPFANVTITNTTSGTAANANGEFLIGIENQHKKERLKISCIGYVSRTFSIDSLNGHLYSTLELNPDLNLLDEIVIKAAPINPAEIVSKAIDSIASNYFNSPFNMEYYSEIVATNIATQSEFKLETILFGYSQGYSSFKQKQFEILQRRSTGEDQLKSIEYSYWPTFELHQVDQIASPFRHGVLNPKQLNKFNLKYSGASLYEADTVFNIEYEARKPTKEITGYGIVPKIYKGNIYITTSNFAIVKHEIITDQFSYIIIYKKINNKYFPYFVSGARSPSALRFLSKVRNSLTLKRIETGDVKVVDSKINEFKNPDEVKYDETYWTNNYPKE